MNVYSNEQLNTIAFPLGGFGTGTICLQGRGSLGGFALRHHPDYRNNPCVFSAVSVKTAEGVKSKLLETAPAPYQVFDAAAEGGLGWCTTNTFGLPRFEKGNFSSQFPFATVCLSDDSYPVEVKLCAWSPFVPTDADVSSMPAAALEYTFLNKTNECIDIHYYFAAENFLAVNQNACVQRLPNGFILNQPKTDILSDEASFCVETDEKASVDACWVRGGWSFDRMTLVWKRIAEGQAFDGEYHDDYPKSSPGATLTVPMHLEPHETKTICIRLCWYVPHSGLNIGIPKNQPDADMDYQPWYAGAYDSITAVKQDWQKHFAEWRKHTLCFTEAFHDTDMPTDLLNAVDATLSVLKSPTVLRQRDGRFWGWEGCEDHRGSCHGSCTHVWNYQQALSHLFPSLERTIRETEFYVSQNEEGHQNFRSALPIQPTNHDFHAAADGQLGGIIKVYRDWRICGNTDWLRSLYPKIKDSLDYCIRTWDPEQCGVLKKAHHNTYDIEFWGADSLCSGFYLAALKAFCEMSEFVGENAERYRQLYQAGREYYEQQLFNGEYFDQKVEYQPRDLEYVGGFGMENGLSPEVKALLQQEGPRYQYGSGCLSDAVLGIWLAEMSGLKDIIDEEKLRKTLISIYRYNYCDDLFLHANPQRPGFANLHDGGLLLCTWPKGNKPSLPFVYSDEVWTGIEYQVASHLIAKGFIEEGITIVRTLRKRYNGLTRNPYDEYECGHWYARAMASYALIQAYSGVWYDAVEQALHVQKNRLGKSFLCGNDGLATVCVSENDVQVSVHYGRLPVRQIVWE